jgi:two-component system cell cycle sensor histidine kinase/response regulator CckA
VDEMAPDLVLGGDERILIVDDDPMQKEVTSRLLRKLGYTTEAVDSGEAALEYLSCRRPDLVIMDMIMSPGMDGAETYRRAIKINPDLKAIIISGYADSDRVKVAMKLGVGTFLKKPMTLQTAAAAVRRELDRKSKKTP